MSKTQGGEAVDGRRLRSERTRLSIVEAALALQEEVVLVPTAQQIADRAGLPIRTFFRHFEGLGLSLIEDVLAEIITTFGLNCQGLFGDLRFLFLVLLLGG